MEELEALQQTVVSYAYDLTDGEVIASHSHRRAQLVYASRGIMAVSTNSALYVVPPQRALWMPAEITHSIRARGAVALRTLYVDPQAVHGLGAQPGVLQVTTLLRELILALVETGNGYQPDSRETRLAQVLLDQLVDETIAPLALPLARDPRLLRVTQALMDEPSDPRGLDDWAQLAGASKRTLNRLFVAQTGMSFRDWRQQRRLLKALELLSLGHSVTQVALELGYEPSAFIAMFRRCVGTTPSRYLRTPIS